MNFGSYRVTRELPSNQTARLCEAHDSTLERRVVLQTPVDLPLDDASRQSFLQTARALAGTNHPHVVTVFEIIEEATPYLVLESINGTTLRDALRYFPPTTADTLRVVREIAEALIAAQANGLTPVELTLDNVWLEPVAIDAPLPKPTRPKLRDFRLAQTEDAVRDRLMTLRWLGDVLAQLLPSVEQQGTQAAALANYVSKLRQSEQSAAPQLAEVVIQLQQFEQRARRRSSVWKPVITALLIGALSGVVGTASMTRGSVQQSASPAGTAGASSSSSTQKTVIEGLKPESKQEQLANTPSVVADTQPKQPERIPEPLPELESLNPAWLNFVSTLPVESRLQAISIEMQRRNPGFDGQLQELWKADGEIRHVTVISDNVVDLMPLRAMTGLRKIAIPGSKSRSGIVEDLRPLTDFELEYLRCGWTRVKDLRPISKMPLKLLRCGGCRVDDLSPIANLPLEDLEIWANPIRDLSPLKTLQKLKRLQMSHILATDISAISGLPITELICEELRVKDWSPLKTLPLEKLRITYDAARHAEVLRAIPTLLEINGKPAKEVLDAVGSL